MQQMWGSADHGVFGVPLLLQNPVRRDEETDAIRGQLLLELASLNRQHQEEGEQAAGLGRALIQRCHIIHQLLSCSEEDLRAKAVRASSHPPSCKGHTISAVSHIHCCMAVHP